MSLPLTIAIVLFMAGHPAGPPRPGFDQAANIVLIVWTLAALPAGILVVRDAIRRRTWLSRDLGAQQVWDFAEISILPTSRLLVAPVDRRGQSASVGSAAPPPMASQGVPFEVEHVETGEQRQGMRRKLSDDEARELATHAERRVWSWFLLIPAVICSGWIVASLRGERPVLGALGIVGFVLIALQLRRSARIRAALRRDSAAGVTIGVPRIGEEPEHEFLPESGLLWTIDAAPAKWRLSPVDRGDGARIGSA